MYMYNYVLYYCLNGYILHIVLQNGISITSGVFESDDSVPNLASPRETPANSSDFCSDHHISSQCPHVPSNAAYWLHLKQMLQVAHNLVL